MHYIINGLNVSIDKASFRLSGENDDYYAKIVLDRDTYLLLKHYGLIALYQTFLTVQIISGDYQTQEYFCEWTVKTT